MTITSTNHNPMNDSKFARRRSIWKGRRNQLREAIAQLQAMDGVVVHEYAGPTEQVLGKFELEWGVGGLRLQRRAPKAGEILGQWVIPSPSQTMLRHLRGSLEADFKMLWKDFYEIAARRVGKSTVIGSGGRDETYNGETVMVFAYGPTSFDLIVSKYGFGDDLKKNHHFFHWQARTSFFRGAVSVDDYEDADSGLTFYVVA